MQHNELFRLFKERNADIEPYIDGYLKMEEENTIKIWLTNEYTFIITWDRSIDRFEIRDLNYSPRMRF